MTTPPMLIIPEVPEWMATLCRKASFDALHFADLFLWTGLAFGVVTAVAEAISALRATVAAESDTNRSAAKGWQAIAEAVTSLLQVLKDAKAWIALLAVGLLLLGIGVSTPSLCVPEEYRPTLPQQTPADANGAPEGMMDDQADEQAQSRGGNRQALTERLPAR